MQCKYELETRTTILYCIKDRSHAGPHKTIYKVGPKGVDQDDQSLWKPGKGFPKMIARGKN